MMKKNLQRMKSLLLFDLPFDYKYISAQLNATHEQYLSLFPGWSLKATRKKVISTYWFNHVLANFGLLYGWAAFGTLMYTQDFNFHFLLPAFFVGMIAFLVLLIINYWPSFYADFLPKLDTLIDQHEKQEKFLFQQNWLKGLHKQFTNEYDQIAQQRGDLAKQKEQSELQQKEMIKCRKAQMHTFSLVLVFYAFDKITGSNCLQCNDRSAALLTKLFGKDQGGVRDCLQLVFGKKQDLPMRQATEIQNRFMEAYAFLEELGFEEGVRKLRDLGAKFSSSSKSIYYSSFFILIKNTYS